MVTKQRRTKQISGGVETIQKPKVIEEYNQYNGWSRQKRSVSDILSGAETAPEKWGGGGGGGLIAQLHTAKGSA